MSLLTKLKPAGFPRIYEYTDEFFTAVVPRLESMLDRRARRLTLSQTFGSAFHSFHPFLLDYPTIRRLLSVTNVRDKESCKQFWEDLKGKSIMAQFNKAKPELEKVHNQSRTQYHHAEDFAKDFKATSTMQSIALDTLIERLPNHFCEPVFRGAFDDHVANSRNHILSEMQLFCRQLEKNAGLKTSEFVDLYNLTVYKNSLAYNCYTRINTILSHAYEHAVGMISIRVPDDNYILRQWSEVYSRYGLYKATSDTCNKVVQDVEQNRFFVTVFCLRDYELGNRSLSIKRSLLNRYLTAPKQAKSQLTEILKEFPFAAPYWVKQYLKLEG